MDRCCDIEPAERKLGTLGFVDYVLLVPLFCSADAANLSDHLVTMQHRSREHPFNELVLLRKFGQSSRIWVLRYVLSAL